MRTIPAAARAARALERCRADLAATTVEREFGIRPEFWARFGPNGRTRCLEDTSFHVTFLVASLTMGLPSIFSDYVGWLVPMLEARGVGRDDVIENFRVLRDLVRESFASDEADAVSVLLDAEIERLAPGTSRSVG